MMDRIVKPKSAEISVTTANTVSNATLVRILNTGAASLITVRDTESNVRGSFTMLQNTVEYVAKEPLDTITCSLACGCTSVAFS